MKILKKLVVLSAVALMGQVEAGRIGVNLEQIARANRDWQNFVKNGTEKGIFQASEYQKAAQETKELAQANRAAREAARKAAAAEAAAAGRGVIAGSLAAGGAALATEFANVNPADVDNRFDVTGSLYKAYQGTDNAEDASRSSVQSNRYAGEEGGAIYNLFNKEADASVTPLSNEEIAAMRAENTAFNRAIESTYRNDKTAEEAAALKEIDGLVGLDYAKQALLRAAHRLDIAKNTGASFDTLRDLQDDFRAAAINVLGQEQALENSKFDFENAQRMIDARNARMTAVKDYGRAVGYKTRYGFNTAKDWTSAMTRNAYDSTKKGFSSGARWMSEVPGKIKTGATSAWERFTNLFARKKQQAAQ